jgi:hypothetical protein
MSNKDNEINQKNKRSLSTDTQGVLFEIHVKGQIDESWSDWLGGLEIELLNSEETRLYGQIRDQAELMGILNKLYSLNLTLLLVRITGQNNHSLKER